MSEKKLVEAGRVTHYFTRIGVAVIKLSGPLSIGDRIYIKGRTTGFTQAVSSMQIEHKDVERAEAGSSVGLKVEQRVREGDIVYKMIEG